MSLTSRESALNACVSSSLVALVRSSNCGACSVMVHLSPAHVGPLGRTQSGDGIDGEMDGGREAGETRGSVSNGWLEVEHRLYRMISVGEGRCTIRAADGDRSRRSQVKSLGRRVERSAR